MERFTLHHGDCLDVLARMPENSVDAVVCDPPYHLTTNKKGGSGVASVNLDLPYGRSRIGTGNGSGGFMGKAWDGGDIAFRPETWAKVLRVLKPGGHLVAFSGTRTYHRMVVAIEDAGFEVRDQLAWVYGSGFPKSHNLPGGFGTALKPAWEPICLARKPLSEPTVAANVLRWGTGALNIDATRIQGGGPSSPRGSSKLDTDTNAGWMRPWVENRELVAQREAAAMERLDKLGRWPANLAHDGSDDVLALFPETGKSTGGRIANISQTSTIYGGGKGLGQDVSAEAVRGDPGYGDSGSAARFFYCAKANKADRAGSKHPTVKPVALMRWLVRMVTPPGGMLLDPFAGTGTTGQAAIEEGFNAILIEREDEYVADIRARIATVLPGETPENEWLNSFMAGMEEYLDA